MVPEPLVGKPPPVVFVEPQAVESQAYSSLVSHPAGGDMKELAEAIGRFLDCVDDRLVMVEDFSKTLVAHPSIKVLLLR